MKPLFMLMLRSLYSRDALRELYALRRGEKPEYGNRSRTTLAIAGILLTALMIFLIAMTWLKPNAADYLRSRPAVRVLDIGTDLSWEMSKPLYKTCDDRLNCYELLRQDFVPLTAVDNLRQKIRIPSDGPHLLLLRSQLKTAKALSLTELNKSVVFGIPNLAFKKMEIYVNQKYVSVFLNNDQPKIVLEKSDLNQDIITVDLVLELTDKQTFLVDSPQILPSFFSTPSEYSEYIKQNILMNLGKGGFAGLMARIVMAVFVLILFIVVDSSPETLGLALFLGFEAFALSLSYGWLPISNTGFLVHFCSQMGDIFRLYFCLQLARMIDKKIQRWILWGSILSIPYALLRHYEVPLNISWGQDLAVWRDIAVGSLGAFVCWRVAYDLLSLRLHWRVAALAIAGIASLQQALSPLPILIPMLRHSELAQSVLDFYAPAAAYLMALSTFINISTLEHRVKRLSAQEGEALAIAKEMELGRSLQQNLHSIPPLPKELQIASFYEAAAYVSGDTYFVDYNEAHGRLVIVLNDVAGHGLQAALKASACQMIAKTIWGAHSLVASRSPEERFLMYDKALTDFLGNIGPTPDVNALACAEINLTDKTLHLFRSNFNLPILVEPSIENQRGVDRPVQGNWRVNQIIAKNKELTTQSFARGSFIVFLSDGFISSSREVNHLLRHLRRVITRTGHNLSAEELRNLIVAFRKEHPAKLDDDRALLVVQWRPAPRQRDRSGLRVA